MSITKKIAKIIPPIRQWSGPKTDKLIRTPGKFGLGQVMKGEQPDASTSMVCGFCSTGCGLNVHIKDGKAINITPDADYPVNIGMACPKGWEALEPLKSDDRATKPLMRSIKGGELEPVSWDTAMKAFTNNFKSVQAEHGKESVAFISTGQIVTEEMAFLGALGKFGMGIKHGDGNTRQCMATSVVAYKQSFGFDAPPYTYQDFEDSDVIILAGSNLCIAHPIMWQRIERNKNNPEIIVIDPRRTETAVAATQHYPIQPKSDLPFFYGIAHILIKNGWVKQEFIDASTSGYEDFAKHVEKFTPELVSQQSGISVEQLEKLATSIHQGKNVSFWWTMGVNQGHEAVRTAQAMMNLALMTGNIGRPGTGANSITGQCNAMGSRLFSNTTGLLGGHDFANAQHRSKVAEILEIDEQVIPNEPSWAYDQIVDGIHAGKIKGLWIIATNGSHSWINQDKYNEAMKKLDYLVVQDMYSNTENALVADLVLPAAGWGEKEGVFINSERRIGLVKKVAQSPGEALSDFNIFKLIASYWGCGEMFKKWSSPEAAFQILTKLTVGQPCDISGIPDYQPLHKHGGIQWPCKPEDLEGIAQDNQRRLFADGKFHHADQRAKFLCADPTEVSEKPSEAYPFILLTGRGTSAQWHTQSRTGKSEVLKKLYPKELYIDVNPEDADTLSLVQDDLVIVSSARATVEVKVNVSSSVQPSQVFLPMHYAKANRLTADSFDPFSRQPSYKYCAVSVKKK
ncbi:nitrate reductase [Akkermansiaceae bacterium]|nr:nitrate reductase [Akkermansiaceae bacterium]